MSTIKIKLDTIDKVKAFVNIVANFGCDLDLVAENQRYVIDAKSIMGIFSLDLSKNLNFIIHSDDAAEIAKIGAAIKEFMVA